MKGEFKMAAKQQQRKQRDNYFKQQIKRFGVNFLQSKTAEDMKFDCVRMFRDIGAGNIDIESEGRYLTDAMFLSVCTNVANSKVFYYQTIASALEMLNSQLMSMSGSIPPETYAVYSDISNSLKAWQLILNACGYLRMNPDYVGIITTLVNQLKPLRKNI